MDCVLNAVGVGEKGEKKDRCEPRDPLCNLYLLGEKKGNGTEMGARGR